MSDVLEQNDPGWRRDPSGRYEWRWWDGHGWTNRVANSAPTAPQEPVVVPLAIAPPVVPVAAAAAPPVAPERMGAPAPLAAAAAPVAVATAAVAPPTVPNAAMAAPVGVAPPAFSDMPGPAVPPPHLAPQPPAPPAAYTGPSAPPAPPVAYTAPSAPPAVPAAPVEPVGDPFAALRAPRNSAPMPPAAHTPVPLAAEPGPGFPALPLVRTYPTAHDGTSGSMWDGPYVPGASAVEAAPTRPPGVVGRVTAAVVGFFRSFSEQEESYHSPNAGAQVPPHPKQDALQPPPNYGRAGLVTLAALGVAIGAYLPWITYRIDDIAHHRTGYDLGASWGFVLASAAFAIAALLGARHRVMGWVTMGASVVVAAMVSIRLLEIHDQVVQLNGGPTVSAEVGIGLWIMLASAAIGLVAAFRLDTPAEIV